MNSSPTPATDPGPATGHQGSSGASAPHHANAADTEGRTGNHRNFRGWIRAHRGVSAAAAVVAAALALVIGTQFAPKGDTTPLSVRNAGPQGSKALSQILGRQGVTVHSPGRYDAAL
ncbi:MAG: hypothetical protein ACLGH7_14440, partial [Actinomycetes bacterium]